MIDAHYGLTLTYRFPVVFTSSLFASTNSVFRDVVIAAGTRPGQRLLVVVDDGVVAAHPSLLQDVTTYITARPEMGALAAAPLVVPGGEAAKQGLDHVMQVVGLVNDCGIDRQSFVVAIGGGAVLDMVSFAAAISHRGVRVVRVPTTTLAQGDSGFAVKNGVNYFGKKNFLGTFVPPCAVLNDEQLLNTLTDRDRRCGLAEAVKVALLKDPEFFEWLEAHALQLDRGVQPALGVAIRRSAEWHLAHICGTGDPFELGSARPLDFGHWSAHKLESLSDHRIRHGEAVAIGMAVDVLYSVGIGALDASTGERILRVLEALGFDLFDDALRTPSASGTWQVVDGLQEFREHLGGQLHVTLLRDIGRPFEAHEIETPGVVAAIEALSRRAAMRLASPQ